MNYDNLSLAEKTEMLENAVINCSPEEIAKLRAELGELNIPRVLLASRAVFAVLNL